MPLSRAGPIANTVTKAPDGTDYWVCLSPTLGDPLSLHVLLDQESHRSNRVSLFDVKACKMSNHAKSSELYLRGELQRQWDLKIKTSKLHLEKKEAVNDITQITLSKMIWR